MKIKFIMIVFSLIFNLPVLCQPYDIALNDNQFPYKAAYALHKNALHRNSSNETFILEKPHQFPQSIFIIVKTSTDNDFVHHIEEALSKEDPSKEFIFSGNHLNGAKALESALACAKRLNPEGLGVSNQVKAVVIAPSEMPHTFLQDLKRGIGRENIIVFHGQASFYPYVTNIKWYFPFTKGVKMYAANALVQTQTNYYDDKPNPGNLGRVHQIPAKFSEARAEEAQPMDRAEETQPMAQPEEAKTLENRVEEAKTLAQPEEERL